jgi:hypothetical protein
MKFLLFPALSVVSLTSCHEKPAPPPAALRLHVTTEGVFAGEHPLPADALKLTEWLSEKIARKAVDPDVRLNFNSEVPASRMVEITDAVFGAGAHTSAYDLAYGMEGWSGGDFLMVHPLAHTEYYSCAVKEMRLVPDNWGEFTALELNTGTQVVFDLTMAEGTLYSGDMELDTNTGVLTELLQARGQSGTVHVTILTDPATTAGDLLATLVICHDNGAEVLIETQKPQEKPPVPPVRRLPLPQIAADSAAATLFGVPNLETQSASTPHGASWLPVQFVMSAETLSQTAAREKQIRGWAGDRGIRRGRPGSLR